MRRVRIYREVVTPESAENGDYESCELHTVLEFRVKDYASKAELIDTVVQDLKSHGALRYSGSGYYAHGWFESEDQIEDYTTDETISYQFILSGFTDEEKREVYARITGRKE